MATEERGHLGHASLLPPSAPAPHFRVYHSRWNSSFARNLASFGRVKGRGDGFCSKRGDEDVITCARAILHKCSQHRV